MSTVSRVSAAERRRVLVATSAAAPPHGEFRELARPERTIRTFVFESFPDQEALETLTLNEKDGKATITTLTVHKTIEGRDGHLSHGMEAGMTDGYALLDDLLAATLGGGVPVEAAR
jgi:uncharacterized protein YndB with AHSA1/START domain